MDTRLTSRTGVGDVAALDPNRFCMPTATNAAVASVPLIAHFTHLRWILLNEVHGLDTRDIWVLS
jgi:hypothetical protein